MKITNRRAFYDYELAERVEAGINLLGAEVKAIKLGHADLSGSHVRIVGSEAYLINAKIFPYEYSRPEGYDEKRTRKLLLHKKEIIAWKSKTDGANAALVPVSLYDKKGLIKVEIAIGKGKKKYEKKQAIKKKEEDRELESDLGLEGYWSWTIKLLKTWQVASNLVYYLYGDALHRQESTLKNYKPTLIPVAKQIK